MSATQALVTMPMKVDNVGFMVDRYGRDCGPLQFVRELTTNAIEAILRTDEKVGQVRWEIDPFWTEFTGVPKLCISDNGIGMTDEEMVRYVNHISSSVHEQSHSGNFGVGAKIAAATRNHAGLVYQSWVEGDGAQIHLWRDPADAQYGLKQFPFEDGTFYHYAGVEDEQKPDFVEQHGTRVTLLGDDQELQANTVMAPSGTPRPGRWLVRYLNMRYFQFPEGVDVRAVENVKPDGTADDRPVHGMKSFLDRYSTASGSVPLTGATAHWWILDAEWSKKVNSVTIEQGHIAALYQDELYEMTTGPAGTSRLQQFGVAFGHGRVVIYVAPDANEDLSANTARTSLVIDGEPLPWSAWAREFREEFPDEINDLIEEAVPSGSDEYKKAIKERLHSIRDLMKLTRYRRAPDGTTKVAAGQDAGEINSPGSDASSRTNRPRGIRPPAPPRRMSDAQRAAASGVPAEELEAINDPKVFWVSVADKSRQPGDIEDRAAKYLPELNQIQVNADFRGFTDMIDRWTGKYEHVPGARKVVTTVLREWFEQSLVETVVSCRSLQHSQYWNEADMKTLLSPEGLTASVMSRYHVENAAKRGLGRKLGSLKEISA